MYKTKKLIGKIATGVLSAMMVFSVGTMTKANCPETDEHHFYLEVHAADGQTWDVTTCYDKYTTSYIYIRPDGELGYGDCIEISAIGRDSYGISYDDFADCSGGRSYYVSSYDSEVFVYNLVVENGYGYGGLYGRDTTDTFSRVEGHFHTDL